MWCRDKNRTTYCLVTALVVCLSLQASNASLTSQLADVQAAAAREKQLLQDKATSAEAAWQGRNKELLEQLLVKERQVAQLSLSEAAALRQAEAATSAQVGTHTLACSPDQKTSRVHWICTALSVLGVSAAVVAGCRS